MKKYMRACVIALLVFVPIVLGTGIANAQSFKSGDRVTVATNEKVDGSVYISGRTLTISGEVNGDVVCAGQTVTITGIVHGDILCVGQTIDISGTVDGSVRAAGQTLTVNGKIGRNASVAGQTVTFGSNSSVAGDASIAGQAAVINGIIGRDLALGVQLVTVNATVDRDIKANGQELTLGSTASARNVAYTSRNNATVALGAKVTGTIKRIEPAQKKSAQRSPFNFHIGIILALFIISCLLFTSIILVLLFPRAFAAVSDHGLEIPGMSLLAGIVASVTVPVFCIALSLSVVGIPLAFLLGTCWFVILCLSGPVFAFYIGRLLFNNSTNPLIIMLLGSLPLLLLYFVPFIGQVLLVVAVFMGTGMIILELKHFWPLQHHHEQHQKTSHKTSTKDQS